MFNVHVGQLFWLLGSVTLHGTGKVNHLMTLVTSRFVPLSSHDHL